MDNYRGEFDSKLFELSISQGKTFLRIGENNFNLTDIRSNISCEGYIKSIAGLYTVLTRKLNEGQIFMMFYDNISNLGYKITIGECIIISNKEGVLNLPKIIKKQNLSEFNSGLYPDDPYGALYLLTDHLQYNSMSEHYGKDINRNVEIRSNDRLQFIIINPEK